MSVIRMEPIFIQRDRSNAVLADFDIVGTGLIACVLFFVLFCFVFCQQSDFTKKCAKTRFVDHFKKYKKYNRLAGQYDNFRPDVTYAINLFLDIYMSMF